MFEKILEIMMEIIFDGTINSAGIKRVPFLFRILTALMIPLFFISFSVFILYVGISSQNNVLILTGILVFVSSAYLTITKIKEYKERNKE